MIFWHQYSTASFLIVSLPSGLYDIKGKKILQIHEKYFVGDIGIRNAVLSYRDADISGLLENLVFLELKRKNYAVYIGKFDPEPGACRLSVT